MESWAALEHLTLLALATLIPVSTFVAAWRASSAAAIMAGAAFGAAFFIWIAGVRVIAPTEVDWTFKLDWRVHFLGWHFFRHEPWHLPPGRIDGYFVPLGTAIGFTDSIPLAAFALKPFVAFLPMPFQYLGAWLLLCYALQGVFGVLIARLFTPSALLQVLSGASLVLIPTLLMRLDHPALCAHWLLLWALWLYLRFDRDRHRLFLQVGVLGLLAGLVHPYLAVMVFGLFAALSLRVLMAARQLGWSRATSAATLVLALAATMILTGWWASGLFTVTGVGNLASEGLGKYSLNLLAPITPTGWSRWLPEWPLGAEGQAHEGFHYFGAGLLGLVLLGAAARAWRAEPRGPRLWPAVAVCSIFALYAISPRITLGSLVIADVHFDWLERASIFRATARFFWPASYLLIVAALGSVLLRVPAKPAAVLLATLVALQVGDLQRPLRERLYGRHDPQWYAWNRVFVSPAWSAALPHYDHMILYPPPHCGSPPTSFEAVAFLAGLHALTINGALVARYDEAKRAASCESLGRSLLAGDVDDRSVYLGDPALIPGFKSNARKPLRCGVIDAIGVCVTAASYASWQSAAALE
jgi:hypothetical protein